MKRSKHFLLRSVSMLLVALLLSALYLPMMASAKVNFTATGETMVIQPANADLPHVTGNFIQPWLYSSWNDARWEQEMETWKQIGIEYVIMGDMANYNKDHKWQVQYATKLDFLLADNNVQDSVSTLMDWCHKYNIKVILGIGLNVNWYDWKIATDEGAAAMVEFRKKYNVPIMHEIYDLYKEKYGDTLYGFYWVEELYNDVGFCDDTTRAAYAKNMSKCFNVVLDEIEKIDPSMPLFFSPHVNPNETGPYSGYSCTDLVKVADFWTQFINQTHFKEIDTLIPQASLDHAACHLDNLEKWTKVYADAIAAADKTIRFWSNLESFHGNDVSVVDINMADHAYSKPLNTFCEGLKIVGKYCPVIFSFAYSHFYTPFTTTPAFHQSYLYYLQTGKVEKNAPVGPNKIKTSTSKSGLLLSWSGQWDDFGIGRTNIYKNGKLVDYIHNQFGNNTTPYPAASWVDNDYLPGISAAIYEIEVIDVSGNVAERVSYAVCAQNENNGVELDERQDIVFDLANPLPEVGAKAPESSLTPITDNDLFDEDSEIFKNVFLQLEIGEVISKDYFDAAMKEDRGVIAEYEDTDCKYRWTFNADAIYNGKKDFDWVADITSAKDLFTTKYTITVTGSEDKPGTPVFRLAVTDASEITVTRTTGDTKKSEQVKVENGYAEIFFPSPQTIEVEYLNLTMLLVLAGVFIVFVAAVAAVVIVVIRVKKRS